MIKVTSTQIHYVAGTVYLYSERIHRIEYPDGTVEETTESLWDVRDRVGEIQHEMKVKKVQVAEAV